MDNPISVLGLGLKGGEDAAQSGKAKHSLTILGLQDWDSEHIKHYASLVFPIKRFGTDPIWGTL